SIIKNSEITKSNDILLLFLPKDNAEKERLIQAIQKVHKEIPVIAIDKKYSFQSEKICIEAGVSDYITKPALTPELLKRSIRFSCIIHEEEHNLAERVKELNCMYQIGKIIEENNNNPKQTLQKIAEVIPEGWQYPDNTCAKIIIDGKTYSSGNFRETKWKLYTTLNTQNNIFGSIEVNYLEEMPNIGNDPFLEEERKLLNEISVRVAKFVEHYKSHEELINNEEKYRNLFNSSRDAILVANTDRRIIDANPAAEQLFGFSLEEIEGKQTEFLYDTSEDYEQMGMELKNLYNKSGFLDLIKYRKKDNNTFYGETNASQLKNSKGEIVGYVGLIRDITDKLQAEKAIKEQNEEYEALNEELKETNERIRTINEELRQSKEKAEESIRLKNAFLANMSHEIRTPMNGIIGFANLMKDNKQSPEKQNEFIDVIVERSHSLLNLLNDIIDLAKIDANQLTIEEDEFSLNLLMDNLQNIFQQELSNLNKAEKISIRISKGFNNENDIVLNDESRLKQIFSNLINNAIKFTKEGTIEFGYKLKDSKTLLFFVKDTGIGIPTSKQEAIFERFRQVDDSITRKYGGTGLGLAITKELVQVLDGEIWVESKEEEGSIFYFTMPYKKSEAIRPDLTRIENETVIYNWKDKHILIIEDDLPSMNYLKEVLSVTNASIITATTGEEGYQQYCNNKEKLSLILMDLRLPDTTGLEITKQIREVDSAIPILAQTAHAMKKDYKSSIEAGCNEHITKPISHTDLLSIIDRYLNNPITQST
ncbi:MAG: ATP-binding protein, partial [Bacteroidales bacterium]